MRVLLVTQWFDPEPNNMKGLVFAKELKKRGIDVEVLTGFPNYPTGKIYDGYRLQWYQKEEMDGITVHRTWLYPSHDGNKWKRMANYFSFGIFAALIGNRIIKGQIDVVYVYHPPVTSTIAAFHIAKRKKAKVVLDVNDLWPDSIAVTGMMNNEKLLNVIGRWCLRTYKKADAINVLSPGIKQDLISRGVPEEKIRVIPVWCNESVITSQRNDDFAKRHHCDEKFTLMYAGAVGVAQGLDVLIDVAKNLSNRYPKIQIIIVGTGTCAQSVQDRIARENLSNIAILPPVPSEEVASVLNTADVLFVHLKKDGLLTHTVPSKIPMYMSLKKPLIVGLEGDAADIIGNADCGVVCEPEDAQAITDALIAVYEMDMADRWQMAEKGFAYYQKQLSLESGINQFAELFQNV